MQTHRKTFRPRRPKSNRYDGLPIGCVFTFIFLAALLLSSDALAGDKFAVVPQRLQPFVSNGEIAGAVALVANRERVLHLSAVGQSDLASGRKMKTTDLFWIASMSKPVTAVAVAMLADDGKLSFDDPVEKYLPEFRDLWVTGEQTAERRVLFKAARPITLRDLLTHTSGLGEYRVTDPHWTLAAIGKVLAPRAAAISTWNALGLLDCGNGFAW